MGPLCKAVGTSGAVRHLSNNGVYLVLLARERNYEFCDDAPLPNSPSYEGSWTDSSEDLDLIDLGVESSSCDHEGQDIGSCIARASPKYGR